MDVQHQDDDVDPCVASTGASSRRIRLVGGIDDYCYVFLVLNYNTTDAKDACHVCVLSSCLITRYPVASVLKCMLLSVYLFVILCKCMI